MGLYDKLNQNIAAGMNPFDPLFGGLIPRRIIEDEQPVRHEPVISSNPPTMPKPLSVRESGIDKVSKRILSGADVGANSTGSQLKKPMNVEIDWTPEKLKLENRKIDIAQGRLTHDQNIDKGRLGLEGRKQEFTEYKGQSDIEIDHRKQALDEWKTRNPEGEVKVTQDGKLVIIDKRSGQSIDTGLMADHLSEEKKLELQAKNAQELEELRQKGRLNLEKNKGGKNISASQQRVAEDDAAAELLRDPRYSWLEKEKLITRGDDGSIKITRPNKGYYGQSKEDALGTIDTFEKEWKTKASERMNKTYDTKGSVETTSEKKTINMVTPDGETIQVPEDEIEEAKSLGAKMAGEADKSKQPDSVKSAIEIIRDSGGRVVYSGNVKGKR